jgi:hypothetical protein
VHTKQGLCVWGVSETIGPDNLILMCTSSGFAVLHGLLDASGVEPYSGADFGSLDTHCRFLAINRLKDSTWIVATLTVYPSGYTMQGLHNRLVRFEHPQAAQAAGLSDNVSHFLQSSFPPTLE